jgi:cyclic beta-1,2-glucan synthetase
VTRYDEASQSLVARNPLDGPFGDAVAFTAAVGGTSAPGWTTSRERFVGRPSHIAAPAALRPGSTLDRIAGSGHDPCFALETVLAIPARGTVECAVVLGEARDERTCGGSWRAGVRPAPWRARSTTCATHWSRTIDRVRIDTPAPELDLMVNGWLAYQTLSCAHRGAHRVLPVGRRVRLSATSCRTRSRSSATTRH